MFKSKAVIGTTDLVCFHMLLLDLLAKVREMLEALPKREGNKHVLFQIEGNVKTTAKLQPTRQSRHSKTVP